MLEENAMDIGRYLSAAVRRKASDILFTAGVPPCLRLNGELCFFDLPPLTPAQTQKLAYSLLAQDQVARFEEEHELDFSFQFQDLRRFRGNCYLQRGAVALVLRLIPSEIPSLDALGLPPILEEFALQKQGLLLFTGPTGHGKSTSQAALIEIINRRRRCHVITIEDPIEFIYHSKTSVIDQRDVGNDTDSFAKALKYVLRQDPDVILIGEMRDLETTAAALTAAETGHLVLGTLHTNSAIKSMERIIDIFPPYQQNQIRMQLSMSLVAVVAQRLLPRADGEGRVVAVEILRNVPAVANLIREGKTAQIASVVETHAKAGMQTLDSSVRSLYQRGLVTRETALQYLSDPTLLRESQA